MAKCSLFPSVKMYMTFSSFPYLSVFTMNMCYFHNHKNICGLNICFGFDFQRRFSHSNEFFKNAVFTNPVTNPSRDPHTSVCPDKCQFCSSRFTCQEIKTHRMSYFRRKCSGILETDDAFSQPAVILLLHEDIVVITLGLTQLDSSRISVLIFISSFGKSL